MCKLYALLVLVLCSQLLESFGEKEYYQYVINSDDDAACATCAAGGECSRENEIHSNDIADEEDDDDDDFDEDLLYGEQIDVIPYDALNDALQDLNAQKNVFKSKRRRSAGLYYPGERKSRSYEELQRGEKSTETNCLADYSRESESLEDETITCRGNTCKAASNRPYADNRHTYEDRESEFYNDGVTRNDLLERKKLEVIRHSFANEKIKLLEADKFIHQIIESLGELEHYEFDDGDNTQDNSVESRTHSELKHTEGDSDHAILLNANTEKHQKPNNKDQVEATAKIYHDYDDTEITKNVFKDYDDFENDDLENKPITLKYKTRVPSDLKDNIEDDISDKTRADSFDKHSLKNQPCTSEKKESVAKEDQDYDDLDTLRERSNSGNVLNDLDYFELDQLEKILTELNPPTREKATHEDYTNEALGAKLSSTEEIVDDPEVNQSVESDEKFVMSKEQYNSYLRSEKYKSDNKELDSAELGVFKIKTETSKPKRKVSDDLHEFELPKFHDIPKVHELPDHHVEKLWNEFKQKYKKQYPRAKIDAKKKSHWQSNHQKVHQHNDEARQGIHSYTLKDNHLSDLHPRHYMKEMARLTHSRIRRNHVRSAHADDSLLIPDHLDWRDKGFITPDWNQEDCGACYAFSVASAIQGQLYKNKSVMEDLSIQQVVDCSIISGNLGCAGGSLRNTLNYVQFAGGLMKAEDYPYKGKQSVCKFKRPSAVVDIRSWSVLPPQDEHALKVTVATIGPVAVSINASPHTFQLYSSGIYDDVACTSDFVNHAMLLVGYTKNSWILKNWWSDHWGDKGYMYLKRGRNRCGVANYAVYALI